MKTQFLKSYRSILIHVLKFFGLCGACFVIEACYGAPQGQYQGTKQVCLEGKAIENKDKTTPTNQEILITNSLNNDTLRTYANENGTYKVMAEIFPTANYFITCNGKTKLIDKKQLRGNTAIIDLE